MEILSLIWKSHLKVYLNNLKKENLLEQVEDKYIKSIVNDEITYFDTNKDIMYGDNKFETIHLNKGIMEEFQWPICMNILEKPSTVPWCGINYWWSWILSNLKSDLLFKCKNWGQEDVSIKNLIPNILVENLSKLYKREWIMKRNIKEIVKETFNSQESELAELSKELEGKTGNFEHINAAKILEEYATDEEDLKILEDVLGLKNVEQELKEHDKTPDDASLTTKPSININSSTSGGGSASKGAKPMPKPMQKMGLLPPMVKRPMQMPMNPAMPGLPQINPMLMLQYMSQSMSGLAPNWLQQMNLSMKQQGKKQSKGWEKDSHRSGDRDKQKKKRKRDRKYDRKDDKSSD